jgi:hypothetical protein
MTTKTMTYTGRLVQTSCYCSVALAIPEDLYKWARRTGGGVYCPLGHSYVYSDSENEKLKRQLKNERDTAARERRWRESAENRLRATKGVVTKLRKRTLGGECPLCGRHLRDLERHVSRQHPNEPVELPGE